METSSKALGTIAAIDGKMADWDLPSGIIKHGVVTRPGNDEKQFAT